MEESFGQARRCFFIRQMYLYHFLCAVPMFEATYFRFLFDVYIQ